MKKTLHKILLCVLVLSASCSDDYLTVPAKGSLSTTQLLNQSGVESLLIGAYSALKANGVSSSTAGAWAGNATNWVFGSVCGQETFKGGIPGEQFDINPLSTFTASATNSYLIAKWGSVYDGINRCNLVLKTLAQVPDGMISDANIERITGEAKFLRAFFHLEAYKVFHNIPYVDETVTNFNLPNTDDALSKIIADFDAAYKSLPEVMPAAGRANKWAAYAFKGKCMLYQEKYGEALLIFKDVIASGKTAGGNKYSLLPKFRDCFDASHDNNAESVFAINSSVNDGSGGANADAELALNYPYGGNPYVTCCGFNNPSLDLANSYRLDLNGLPILDGSFNSTANELSDITWLKDRSATSVARDVDPLDPRCDWTLGRTGVPFLDWGVYNTPAWVRSLSDGGPYTPKKYNALGSTFGTLTDKSSTTAGYEAVNMYLMRFADVLLMAAECEVEAGTLSSAMDYVNLVRSRQLNEDSWVKISSDASKTDWQAYIDPSVASTPAGNYTIALYGTNGDVTFNTKATARKAVHMERKLELALEGHRFFDLVRWGEVFTTNANGNDDCLESAYLYNVSLAGSASLGTTFQFKTGKSEQWPIPQNQVDLSQGVLKQNPGY
ncbi:MAG: RagB/SusD family nutrient uptake outer membrane protein [Bacteroidota bacterium]